MIKRVFLNNEIDFKDEMNHFYFVGQLKKSLKQRKKIQNR